MESTIAQSGKGKLSSRTPGPFSQVPWLRGQARFLVFQPSGPRESARILSGSSGSCRPSPSPSVWVIPPGAEVQQGLVGWGAVWGYGPLLMGKVSLIGSRRFVGELANRLPMSKPMGSNSLRQGTIVRRCVMTCVASRRGRVVRTRSKVSPDPWSVMGGSS